LIKVVNKEVKFEEDSAMKLFVQSFSFFLMVGMSVSSSRSAGRRKTKGNSSILQLGLAIPKDVNKAKEFFGVERAVRG
jgi:hypothetical protein